MKAKGGVLLALVLTGGAAHAAPNTSPAGKDAADAVCRGLYYESEKVACLEANKQKKFNLAAVGVCAKLYYESERRACLQQIAGLRYEDSAVEGVCAKLYYESERVSCLVRLGEPGGGSELETEELLARLVQARDLIDDDRPAQARRVITRTIKDLRGENDNENNSADNR